jgi:hypothetical protein
MRRDAERYSALFNQGDAFWSEYPVRVKKSIRAIAIIDPSQMYSVILAALERFSKDEVDKLLRLVEVLAVRYQMVQRGRPGRMESLGSVVARAIWSQKVTSATEVKAELNELYTSDVEFKQGLLAKTERDGDKARYLLLGIERQSLLRDGQTFADELGPSEALTVEHIFPKSHKGYWHGLVSTDAKLPSMLYRLGNMCLLASANRAIGNKTWEEKVDVYRRSMLRITNQLSLEEYPTWGSEAISKRQEYMAELAVREWRWP